MLRNERFPQSYLTNVESLLNVLSPYLTSKHKDMPQEVQQLNVSIAFFLKVITIGYHQHVNFANFENLNSNQSAVNFQV